MKLDLFYNRVQKAKSYLEIAQKLVNSAIKQCERVKVSNEWLEKQLKLLDSVGDDIQFDIDDLTAVLEEEGEK